MPIVELELANVRVYHQALIQPDERFTIINGPNAAGKTSILEAIHILATGRTFRGVPLEQVVQTGSPGFSIKARYEPSNGGSPYSLRTVYRDHVREISINGSKGSRQGELAQILPVLVISPDSHFEFLNSAKERRSVLDWGLFHVEPGFHDNWSRYQRVLAQRNSALKDPRYGATAFSWDDELAHLAELLQASRQRCLDDMVGIFRSVCREFLGPTDYVDFDFHPGWETSVGMDKVLLTDRSRDLARGYTNSGPHRSDLRVYLNHVPARETASHGQNKILVIALRIAQIEYLYHATGRQCCLLIDDLAAELDATNRALLLGYLAAMPVQVIITATEEQLIGDQQWASCRTFHVEHGAIWREPSSRNHPQFRQIKC